MPNVVNAIMRLAIPPQSFIGQKPVNENMDGTRLSKETKREILQNINAKTKACTQNRKNVNRLVDIISYCETYEKENAIVTACIGSFKKIFSRFIDAEDMLLKENLTGDEAGLSNEEKYKVWLRRQYQVVVDKLLALVLHNSTNIQELALSTLMKFVACEGHHTVRKMKFPDSLYGKILSILLSKTKEIQNLLPCFQEYLEYDDVRYFTLKYIMTSCRSRQTQGLTENFLGNIFAVLDSITLPSTEDKTYSNFLSKLPDQNSKLRQPSEHKKTFTSAWVEFLRLKLPSSLYRKVLVILHERVMPYMTSPLMLSDFLTESYNIGGAISLLSLNGLFILIQKYNLYYPDFYTKLYALFETSVFHVKYRSRFFHLADLFLSSTHLPSYLVAAFIKRLGRISLTAPPSGVLIAVPFIYNLINRHPSCKCLIDRQGEIADCGEDPYDVTESDPSKCHALESSLWELKTLQSHYYPDVSKISQYINDTVPKEETDLGELLETTEDDLFDKEQKKKFKSAAVTFEPPKGLLSTREDRLSLCWSLT